MQEFRIAAQEDFMDMPGGALSLPSLPQGGGGVLGYHSSHDLAGIAQDLHPVADFAHRVDFGCRHHLGGHEEWFWSSANCRHYSADASQLASLHGAGDDVIHPLHRLWPTCCRQ